MCRTFLGGYCWGQPPRKGEEGSRTGQRGKWSCAPVSVASAETKGSSEAPQNCPQLGNWGRGFVPPWTSHGVQAIIGEGATLDKAALFRGDSP